MFRKKFKPLYLLIFIIPLLYLYIFQRNDIQQELPEIDFLYFSAKSSKHAKMQLFSGDELLTTWELNANTYKYFDYSGCLKNRNNIILKINELSENDTITFLSFNIFRGNTSSSLYQFINPDEYLSNAHIIPDKNAIKAIVKSSNTPLSISFKPSEAWKTKNTTAYFILFFELIFLSIFILLHILSPPNKYFIAVVFISVILMLLFSTSKPEHTATLEMTTTSPLKKAEFFFSHYPQFTHIKNTLCESNNNTFKTEIDLKHNRFFRLDVNDIEKLENVKFNIKYGIFSKSWKLSELSEGKLCINDMNIINDTFYPKGIDPFICFSSDYFNASIRQLIFLRESTFLFVALLAFIILICLHKKLSPYLNITFKYVYLIYFLIPLSYFILYYLNTDYENKKPLNDYLYFSAKVNKPTQLSLYAGEAIIASWHIEPGGFKYLDCVKNMNDSNGLTLKIDNFTPEHGIALTSLNFFRNNTLYTLYDFSNPYCHVENAWTINFNGAFTVVGQNPELPALINLAKTQTWTKMHTYPHPPDWVLSLFIIAFLILLLAAPPTRYLIYCIICSILLMGIFSWIGKDIQEQLTFKTGTPQRSVESYYSNIPVFNTDDKFPSKTFMYYFKTQVELNKNHFFRCDLDDSLKHLNNFEVVLKTGLLKEKFNFSTIPLSKMVLNDVDYEDGKFIITGNDPFFALTSTYFVDKVKRLAFTRYNAFLFISLFVFILLISIHKKAAPFKHTSFFLFIFFITLICNGLLLKPFNSERVRLISEKRDADSIPKFEKDSLKKFTQAMNAYLNDQVSGRNNIIPFNNYLYYSVFGQLLNHPDVYFGKNGWMYYIGANGRETYENRTPVTTEELETIKHLFEERHNWLKERGIKLYIVFPRVSQFIYEEHLGSRLFRYNKTSKLEQLMHYLNENSDIEIIDVEKPILDAKNKINKELYYKSSTHWNFIGGYFAYKAIIEHIHKDFPDIEAPIPFEEIKWTYTEDMKKDLDLIEMAALIGYVKAYEYLPVHPKVFAGDTIVPHFPAGKPDFPYKYIVNPKKKQPNMLMLHDSYERHLYPFLGHHFNRSTYLWTNTFERELIEANKPDIVIWEMSERFIPFYVIYKNPPFEK